MIEAHFTRTPGHQCIFQKTLASIIYNNKILEAFLQATNAHCLFAIQYSIGGAKQCSRARKRNKNIQIRENSQNCQCVQNDMLVSEKSKIMYKICFEEKHICQYKIFHFKMSPSPGIQHCSRPESQRNGFPEK